MLFSDEVKQGLLRHLPGLLIADVYGSSEAIAAARPVSRSGAAGPPARSFTGGGLTVLADDDTPVVPGSGQIGRSRTRGVRGSLAGYQVPRQVVAVPKVTRGPNGKIDIPRIRALLAQSAAPAWATAGGQCDPGRLLL